MPGAREQALIAFGVTFAYCILVVLANWFAALAGGDDASPNMMISGSLLAFVAIPVFSIILPLWLARRWQLAYAWWPQSPRHWLTATTIVAGYVFLLSFYGLQTLLADDFDPARFAMHFVSAMLFHVPYYPLFAILVLRTSQRWLGLPAGIGIAAALFSLYHMTQYYFFPSGTEPIWLLLLYVAFIGDLLVYLVTRSLGLVALGHCLTGAVGMASAGTYFDGIGFVFFATIIIIGALFAWTILDRKRHDGAAGQADGNWLQLVAAAP